MAWTRFVWLVAAALTLPQPAPAQSIADLPEWARARQEVPKRAFVIGVGDYGTLPDLATPARDAQTVATRLRAMGFEVTHHDQDLSYNGIIHALRSFREQLREGDIALVYFSGHGFERDGTNFLAPADMPATFPSQRVDYVAVSLNHIMAELAAGRAALSLILLDACREDPFPPSGPGLTGRKGLAAVPRTPTGVFLGFAAAPGRASWGGLTSDLPNTPSLFSRHLVNFLGAEGRSIYWTWREAGTRVWRDSGEEQLPWYNADVFFPEFRPVPSAADRAEFETAWAAVAATDPRALQAELEEYLRHYPDSPFAATARAKIAELRTAPDASLIAGTEQERIENLTRLALETREIRGSVVSASIARSFADLNEVYATASSAIRTSASEGAPTLASIDPGTRLSALSVPDANGWMAVRLPDGQVGFLDRVFTALRRELLPSDRIRFLPGATTVPASAIDRALLDAARQPGTIVSIEISAASADLPDRARTLAYLRGLAIRSALRAQGVTPDRMRVRLLSRNPAARDEAVLRLLR